MGSTFDGDVTGGRSQKVNIREKLLHRERLEQVLSLLICFKTLMKQVGFKCLIRKLERVTLP